MGFWAGWGEFSLVGGRIHLWACQVVENVTFQAVDLSRQPVGPAKS